MNDLSLIKQKAIPILRQAGVTRSSIFGSFVRSDEKKTSDIDILVDLPEETDLFGFVDLKLKLEDKLKRKVDLVEYSTIRPELKENILKKQVRIL